MWFFTKYRAYRQQLREEFRELVAPLLRNELVLRLDSCKQHFNFTRLRHSMDVAYLSFFVTRVLGWNSGETARAALLHDLFFHGEGQHCMSLMRSHPAIAVENARQVCVLTPREENIIRRHMWLGATITPPKYREGYVVTVIDKYCACRELLVSLVSWRRPRTVMDA